MKNILILFVLLLLLSCNSHKVSIFGNWATIIENREYNELYISKDYIRLIDASGAEANMFDYDFNGKNLNIPYYTYEVKYGINNCHLIFYNNKDTIFLEKIHIKNINIQNQNLNTFFLRKYNYLVSNNIISADSAIKSIQMIKINNKEPDIEEINLDHLLNRGNEEK